jgi:hypothetical protein
VYLYDVIPLLLESGPNGLHKNLKTEKVCQLSSLY